MNGILFQQPIEIATKDGFLPTVGTVYGPFAVHANGCTLVEVNEDDGAEGYAMPLYNLTHLHTGWSLLEDKTDEGDLLNVAVALTDDPELCAFFDNNDVPDVMLTTITPAMKARMIAIVKRALGQDVTP